MTGGSGLIGSHVVRELLESGYEPRVFSRRSRRESATIEHVSGDVRDPEALVSAMSGCGGVVHAAAVYSYARADRANVDDINVQGTRNVLDAAVRAGVDRVVVTSSSATCGPVAGRPADESDAPPAWELDIPYKRSKLAAERLAISRAKAGQDVVVVNPTTTIGPGDERPTPSGRIVRDVLTGRIRGYLRSGGLNVVSARDVARGHVSALERGKTGERYLLGGENVPMRQLFTLIARLGGVSPPRLAVPYALALSAAHLTRVIPHPAGGEWSLLTLDEVRLARLPMYFTVAKAERELGYSYQPAAPALAGAVAWFMERQAQEEKRKRGLAVLAGRT